MYRAMQSVVMEDRKKCSHEGYTNVALGKGLCDSHGGRMKKQCSHEGCTYSCFAEGRAMRSPWQSKKEGSTCSKKSINNFILADTSIAYLGCLLLLFSCPLLLFEITLNLVQYRHKYYQFPS